MTASNYFPIALRFRTNDRNDTKQSGGNERKYGQASRTYQNDTKYSRENVRNYEQASKISKRK